MSHIVSRSVNVYINNKYIMTNICYLLTNIQKTDLLDVATNEAL